MKQEIPKYFAISQEIIETIKKGDLAPGMKVPSENEIIKDHKVSNTTARKILQEMESAGWVTKIKGKGTYVRQNNIVRSATRILSFTKNMLESGHKPSTKVLNKKLIKKGYSAVINGRRYTMQGPVYKIHRLRYADNIPMMLEIRYISLNLCPDIEKETFKDSLYNIYKKKYNYHLSEVNQMLSTIMVKNDVLKYFCLEESIPAFLIEGVTFCGREMILEMEKSIYRGDKYRFSIRAT
ncbi:GntR family transcriptional regulator [candidate division KSB1 bacterium]